MSNILDIVAQFKRPLVEGEAVLDSKMLVLIGRLTCTDDDPVNVLKVWCLCLQSSSVFAAPHQIDVHIDISKSGVDRFLKFLCTCTARESAKCKHLIALLLHLFKLEDEEDLEELSCTDLEQQWGKIKDSVKKDFQPIPISEYESVDKYIPPVYSRGIPSVSANLAAEFAPKIAMGDRTSEIFMHSHRQRANHSKANVKGARDEEASVAKRCDDAMVLTSKLLEKPVITYMEEIVKKCEQKLETLSADLREFYYEHVVVSKERSSELAKQTSSQCEEQWFNQRMLRITGSKCYSLYTYSSNKSPDWDKKMKATFNPSFVGNEATMYGINCEPLARDVYSIQTGHNVLQNGLFVNPLAPWLGCSVDGLVVDGENNPEFSIEIKCLTVGKTVPASNILKLGKCFAKSLKKKHEYYAQVQLGLMLMGLPKCDFIVYSSFDQSIEIIPIPFDIDFSVGMVARLIDVYFDVVLPWIKKNIQLVSA